MAGQGTKISVLVSARKNSKFLAKFIFGYLARTTNPHETELLVMLNADDDWNDELKWYFGEQGIRFFTEDYKLGRAGLHQYLNDMVPEAKGDWLVYFCEDHFIIEPGWDQKIRSYIRDRELDSSKIYTIVPKFDNCGAMNQIVSRGFVDTLGGVFGRHGWIDSYINELNTRTFGDHSDRVIRMDEELFHDFTHDHPNPMEQAHMQGVVSPEGKKLPVFEADEVREIIGEDVNKLKIALEGGK